ncbi:MAG: GLPGLI family protein [Prevotellaceae bacterium]|jgi:GLPGLI family protein|nr:GLPGLI family protein [Prevotellaceae bacterium]
MKKKIILAAILILFVVQQMMGQEILDTAILRCKYKFTHIINTEKNTGYSELMTLDIGKNICKYYSEKQKLYDSIMRAQIMQAFQTNNKKITISALGHPPGNVRSVVYFNYPAGKITVFERIIEFYEYTENIENINWKFFQNETKELLGYNCNKVTCTFRGRDYEAWYTPDIPINGGVWKFGGLPGLILSLTDTKKQVQFVCESVEKVSVPINKDAVEGSMKISRKEYISIDKKFHEAPMSILGEHSIGTGTDANGNPLPPVRNLPYNPIELE